MTPLDVGRGARDVAEHPGTGRVIAVYRSAAYLRFPAGVFAVTTGTAPPGPLHLRVAALPELHRGDEVRGDGTALHGGGWTVPVPASTWTGSLPPASLLTAARPGPAAGPLAGLAAAGDLCGVAAALGGRGPGLTPSGDDVLAGVLLVARALWGEVAEPDLLAAAGSVVTTDVAAAFLSWAARGQCIDPVHRWLAAVAHGDGAQVSGAAARLTGVGASSGRALLTGLRLGLAALPAT
ncbi:MAG: DUF2877 domain-containing protein [Actinobacteria bacterium]|nr:DUF2877 domain-containing protein [Actinomycetota bacterium]